ncbi:MAG: hypothetical protein AAF721_05820 [Myxococcota bacterium]
MESLHRVCCAGLVLAASLSCKTHTPSENTAASLAATGAGATAPQDTFVIESTTMNEFTKSTTLQIEVRPDDTTVVEYVEHAYREGLAMMAAPTIVRGPDLVVDVKTSDAGQTERIAWTFRCLTPRMSSVTFVASWWEDPPAADPGYFEEEDASEIIVERETTVVVDCTSSGGETTDSLETTGDPEGSGSGEESGWTTGDDASSDDATGSSESGVVDPPEAEPIHLYMPTDLEPVVYVFIYEDDALGPLEIPSFPIDSPATHATATNDGGGVYFGGTNLSALARDRSTGDLTPVGSVLPWNGTVGWMSTSPEDDRIFVADLNVTLTEVTQYEIGGDYGLVEGAAIDVGAFPRSVVVDIGASYLYGTFSQDGGGLVGGELTAPSVSPALTPVAGSFPNAGAAIVDSAAGCLWVTTSAGLSGPMIQSLEIEAGGGLNPVGSVQGRGELQLTADGGHLVALHSGATGRIEVFPRLPGCALGDAVDGVDTPLGIQRYSNLAPFGASTIFFEFNAGTVGRAIEVDAKGTINVGGDLDIPDGVRSAVALVVEE